MKRRTQPRLKSLIVTLWGDALMPYGGCVWLGCLPDLLVELGFEEGAVRVSLQRLVSEGWLASQAEGRRRDLQIAGQHVAETQRVQALIYSDAAPDWNGTWLMLHVAPKSAADREAIRRAAQQNGFAPFSPNNYVHPHARWSDAAHAPGLAPYANDIIAAFETRELSGRSNLATLWDTHAIAARWREIDRLIDIAEQANSPQEAFGCQLLLIHEMRRLILAYPSLPRELVPEDWPETCVRARLPGVYDQLSGKTHIFLRDALIRSDGKRPDWQGYAPKRFGRDG